MKPEKIIERSQRCVCRSCGSTLEPKVMIYNKYGGHGLELVCPNCSKIEYGTEPEIYKLARDFVYNVEFDYFPDMEPDEKNLKLNVAKVCEILSWHFRKLGILDAKGLHKERTCNFDYSDEDE